MRSAFGLDESRVAEQVAGEHAVVLNYAGPFDETADPLVEACLAAGTHSLDITGEIDVFEAIHDRDAAAGDRGVVLLPGVGFDVVPTDCLAAPSQTGSGTPSASNSPSKPTGPPPQARSIPPAGGSDEPGSTRPPAIRADFVLELDGVRPDDCQ